jgi:hypothetical protein
LSPLFLGARHLLFSSIRANVNRLLSQAAAFEEQVPGTWHAFDLPTPSISHRM